MEQRLARILQKGKIESNEEENIVFSEWRRLFDSAARLEELMPYHNLLKNWEGDDF